MSRKYKVVDVFTAQPLLGNPVAVVLDSEGLDAAAMQQIARWTNLSETTFVLPPTRPEADYRLRIFTPGTNCRSPVTRRSAARTRCCECSRTSRARPRSSGVSAQQASLSSERIRRAMQITK
jgi:hypothetical protein